MSTYLLSKLFHLNCVIFYIEKSMASEKQKNGSRRDTGAEMGVGLALGVAIGVAMDNLAIGIALGLVLGISVGTVWL